MNRKNRTDRIIVTVALLVLLLASGMFYFDEWMWGTRRDRGERIGVITDRQGDVRLKYEGDLKWSKASTGQDLVYDDAVYAGAGSRADLQVGDSKLTVTENSLIVLRRNQDVNFLNLTYGTLFGKIAKNEKIVIDTGNGKPIHFSSSKDAQIVLRRSEGKTALDVTSGEAVIEVDGVKRKVDKSSRLVFGDKTPAELRSNKLRLIRPTHNQVISSENPTRIEFNWAWENGRAAGANERFTLEFSPDASFKKIHTTKHVQGALNTNMTVSRSLSLYYRVKSGKEVSAAEQVHFVRLERPVIVKPLAGQHYEAPKGRDALAEIEFQRPAKASVWYQIAADPEFKQVLVNQNTTELKQVRELPLGQYYLRARSDFGSQNTTSWTEPRTFSVQSEPEMFPLAKRHTPSRIVIPNRAYPRHLYGAADSEVKGFLADRGFLRSYFPYKQGEIDELRVQIDNGDKQLYTQADPGWPSDKLFPSRHLYRYQVTKSGFRPSEWSAQKKLDIVMEPPKPLGEAIYGEPNQMGNRQATWGFTPLLFARSYDVEVSSSPGFVAPIELKTERPQVLTELPEGEYYWRARARDAQGRIISSFSHAYKLKSMPAAVPQFLAKNKPEQTRKPAQATERTATRVERVREKAWERSGWWAWIGTGENYVDYRQSISGGTLNAHRLKGPSQFFEGGFTGANGIGGVISYKNTPGEFQINDLQASEATQDGVQIIPNTYRWTTLGLEAIAKKTSPFSLWNTPIVYGMRVGVQQHTIPFLFLPDTLLGDPVVLYLKNNQISAASIGALAEMTRSRWTYYWLMRYQYPLSAKADGSSVFEMKPVFAFDGSLGTSYNFTQQMKVGLFWYGQWHQFNFSYGDGTVVRSGFQSLFYSNLDIRFGMDF